MLLPLKAVCDRKKARRDGSSLIYIQYCYSSTNRTLLNTEIAIPATYWNGKRECLTIDLPPEHGNSDTLNAEVSRMIRVIEDTISYAQKMGINDVGAFVKKIFTPAFSIEKLTESVLVVPLPALLSQKPELFTEIESYIKSKEKKVCSKGMANFHPMRDHLLSYQQHLNKTINFQSFDYNFYLDYVDFLNYLPTTQKKDT